MFLRFYGLRTQPFGVTADPRFLYPSSSHQKALAALFCGIENDLGFTSLVAEPGLGKTTLLFHVLETFRHTALSAFLFETHTSSAGLLRGLLKELNVNPEDKDPVTLHEQFRDVLVSAARTGRRVIIILDEAQNLEPAVLEGVRLLSNFESRRSKLLHIILSGQPQLSERLARPELAQLQQRLSMTAWLKPLEPGETAQYVRHRLRVGGYTGDSLFSDAALETIARESKGIPRTINRICFNALFLGSSLEERCISEATVEKALSEDGIPLRAMQQAQGSRGDPLAENHAPGTQLAARREPPGQARNAAGPDRAQEKQAPEEPHTLSSSLELDEPERQDSADLVANLALVYHKQGRFAEAEALHRRTLRIRESVYGPDHPKVATSLNNLALLYRDQGKIAEAKQLLERSLAIVEKSFGPDHPKTALRARNLAQLTQRKYDPRHCQPVSRSSRSRRWWNVVTTFSAMLLGPGARTCF